MVFHEYWYIEKCIVVLQGEYFSISIFLTMYMSLLFKLLKPMIYNVCVFDADFCFDTRKKCPIKCRRIFFILRMAHTPFRKKLLKGQQIRNCLLYQQITCTCILQHVSNWVVIIQIVFIIQQINILISFFIFIVIFRHRRSICCQWLCVWRHILFYFLSFLSF